MVIHTCFGNKIFIGSNPISETIKWCNGSTRPFGGLCNSSNLFFITYGGIPKWLRDLFAKQLCVSLILTTTSMELWCNRCACKSEKLKVKVQILLVPHKVLKHNRRCIPLVKEIIRFESLQDLTWCLKHFGDVCVCGTQE